MESIIINKEDYEENFWGKNWRITVPFSSWIVNARCEGDAFDILVDWCEENAPGYLFSIEEVNDMWNNHEDTDDYWTGGNHGRMFNEMSIHIEEIRA